MEMNSNRHSKRLHALVAMVVSMRHCSSLNHLVPKWWLLGRTRKLGLAKGRMSLGTGFQSPKVQAILSSLGSLFIFEMWAPGCCSRCHANLQPCFSVMRIIDSPLWNHEPKINPSFYKWPWLWCFVASAEKELIQPPEPKEQMHIAGQWII